MSPSVKSGILILAGVTLIAAASWRRRRARQPRRPQPWAELIVAAMLILDGVAVHLEARRSETTWIQWLVVGLGFAGSGIVLLKEARSSDRSES